MAAEDARLSVELSRMYWASDLSVAGIADALGLSRRALYEALVPAPAGGSCLECGGELVYVNRSNRAMGRAECQVCGREQRMSTSDAADAAAEQGVDAGRLTEIAGDIRPTLHLEADPEFELELDAGPMAPFDVEAAAERRRILLMGAVAVAGVAIGAATTLLVTRR